VLLRGVSLPAAFFLALLTVIVFSLVLRVVRREVRKVPRPGRRREPAIADGDIGPYVSYHLERGDREAVVACLAQHIPAAWRSREGLLMLAEEHCRLQHSIRIARMANVPLPDGIADFSRQQTQLIADRARRMAFVYQHGLTNSRIEASLDRLTQGSWELAQRSVELRAELAESTSTPQWSEHEERELRRKLERMSNTLRAMSQDVLTEEFDALAAPPKPQVTVGS
jgi:hypothetical protein